VNYDAIVLGLGGMGSATAATLSRRGLRVLGIEQFDRGHALGSSHGHTRIIRTAYYEHPDYVPLCQSAFAAWYELEQCTGRHLLTQCPCLNLGPKNSDLIHGVTEAADQHRLDVQQLGPGKLRQWYPQFQFDDDIFGIMETASGFLYVDDCVRALQDDAIAHGAELRFGEPVLEWKCVGDTVAVRTAWETLSAARLVVTAGPWARVMLADLHLPLTVMRQVPMWFRPTQPDQFRRDRFPIFIADLPGAAFYGLPMIDPRGVKVAMHYGSPELPGPESVNRNVSDADEVPARQFLNQYLPAAAGPRTHASACLYTLTPDRHFIIDRHPEHANVAIAAGFSGHGFKFVPVVGEALADLVTEGKTQHPVGMFSLRRFGHKS
jgi:sarcosine oxidase